MCGSALAVLLLGALAATPSRRGHKGALIRAGGWLASFPAEDLQIDAAVGLWHIRQHVQSPSLYRAWKRAEEVAERSVDNPMRRFWDPEATAPTSVTAGWDVPAAGAGRADSTRVVIEALHCAENGWRPEATQYVAGPMRDGGGAHSTHALWAVHLARQNDCLIDAIFNPLVVSLQQELREHQPADFRPESTIDIDRYAGRLLMLVLTEDFEPPLPEWFERLVDLQNPDGSWGIDDRSGEDPYLRYHATLLATWALAAWASG